MTFFESDYEKSDYEATRTLSFLCMGISIFLIILLIGVLIADNQKVKNYHQACKNLGFESYSYNQDFNFCIDKDGNYHLIEIKCQKTNSFLCRNPIIKEISIGSIFINENIT